MLTENENLIMKPLLNIFSRYIRKSVKLNLKYNTIEQIVKQGNEKISVIYMLCHTFFRL